jgi:hypothetical protein
MLISLRVGIKQLPVCDFFFCGVVDGFPYFLLRIDDRYLHIPYQDMDMFVVYLFCHMVQTGEEVVSKEYIQLL